MTGHNEERTAVTPPAGRSGSGKINEGHPRAARGHVAGVGGTGDLDHAEYVPMPRRAAPGIRAGQPSSLIGLENRYGA